MILFNRTSPDRLQLFYQKIAAMLTADMSMAEAIQLLAETEEKSRMKTILQTMVADISKGKSVPEVCRQQSELFPPSFLAALKSQQPAEQLARILEDQALAVEQQKTLTKQVRQGLSYPLFMIIVGFFCLSVMFIFVVPVYQEMFDNMGSNLPYMTKLMVDFADFFTDYLIAPVIILAVITILLSQFKKPLFYRIMLAFPLAGKALNKLALLFIVRDLTTMLSFKMAPGAALQTAAHSLGNHPVKQEIEESGRKLAEGEVLSSVLANHRFFPQLFIQMLTIAEKTGSYDSLLSKYSKILSEEIMVTSKRSITFFSRLVFSLIVCCVIFYLIAMYLPIFSIAASV